MSENGSDTDSIKSNSGAKTNKDNQKKIQNGDDKINDSFSKNDYIPKENEQFNDQNSDKWKNLLDNFINFFEKNQTIFSSITEKNSKRVKIDEFLEQDKIKVDVFSIFQEKIFVYFTKMYEEGTNHVKVNESLQKLVSEKEIEIVNLKKEIEDLVNNLSNNNKKIGNLKHDNEDELSNLKNENEKLKKQMEEIQVEKVEMIKKFQEFEQEIKILSSQLEELKTTIKESNGVCDELNENIQRCQICFKNYEEFKNPIEKTGNGISDKENIDMKKNLESTSLEANSLKKSDYSSLEMKSIIEKYNISNEKSILKEKLNWNSDEKNEKFDEIIKDNTNLSNTLIEMEKNNKEINEKLEEAKDEIDNLNLVLEDYKLKIVESSKISNELTKFVEDSITTIINTKDSNKDLPETNDSTNDKKEILKKKKNLEEENNSKTRKISNDLSNNVVNGINKNDSIIVNKENEIPDEDKKKNIDSQIDFMKEQILLLTNLNKELDSKIEIYKLNINNLENENKKISEKLEIYEKKENSQDEKLKINGSNDDANFLNSQLMELKNQIQESSILSRELKDYSENLSDDIKENKNSIQNNQVNKIINNELGINGINIVSSTNATPSADLQSIQERQKQTGEDDHQYKRNLVDEAILGEKLVVLKSNIDDLLNKFTQISPDNINNSFNKHLEELLKLDLKLTQLNEAQINDTKNKDDLNSNIKSKSNKDQNSKNFEEEIIALNKVIEETNKLNDEIKYKMENLKIILSEKESEKQNLISRFTELNKSLSEMSMTKDLNTILINENDQLKKSIENIKLELESKISLLHQYELQNQNDVNLKFQLEDLKSKLLDKDNIILNYAQEIKEKTANITNLSKKEDEIKMHYTTEISNIHSNIEKLKETNLNLTLTIDEKNEIILNIQQKLSETETQYELKYQAVEERSNKKILDLEQHIQDLKDQLIQGENKFKQENKFDLMMENYQDLKEKCIYFVNILETELKDFEYYIDKRLVINFLLKYFDKNSNEKLKYSLLDTIANILNFDNDNRKKVHLMPISLNQYSSNNKIMTDMESIPLIISKFSEYLASID